MSYFLCSGVTGFTLLYLLLTHRWLWTVGVAYLTFMWWDWNTMHRLEQRKHVAILSSGAAVSSW